MADLLTYALLSGRAYPSTPVNQIALPTTSDWKEVETPKNDSITGFSTGVYKKVTTDETTNETTNETTTEIVIAFTGTDETLWKDFSFANIQAYAGLPSQQVVRAILWEVVWPR